MALQKSKYSVGTDFSTDSSYTFKDGVLTICENTGRMWHHNVVSHSSWDNELDLSGWFDGITMDFFNIQSDGTIVIGGGSENDLYLMAVGDGFEYKKHINPSYDMNDIDMSDNFAVGYVDEVFYVAMDRRVYSLDIYKTDLDFIREYPTGDVISRVSIDFNPDALSFIFCGNNTNWGVFFDGEYIYFKSFADGTMSIYYIDCVTGDREIASYTVEADVMYRAKYNGQDLSSVEWIQNSDYVFYYDGKVYTFALEDDNGHTYVEMQYASWVVDNDVVEESSASTHSSSYYLHSDLTGEDLKYKIEDGVLSASLYKSDDIGDLEQQDVFLSQSYGSYIGVYGYDVYKSFSGSVYKYDSEKREWNNTFFAFNDTGYNVFMADKYIYAFDSDTYDLYYIDITSDDLIASKLVSPMAIGSCNMWQDDGCVYMLDAGQSGDEMWRLDMTSLEFTFIKDLSEVWYWNTRYCLGSDDRMYISVLDNTIAKVERDGTVGEYFTNVLESKYGLSKHFFTDDGFIVYFYNNKLWQTNFDIDGYNEDLNIFIPNSQDYSKLQYYYDISLYDVNLLYGTSKYDIRAVGDYGYVYRFDYNTGITVTDDFEACGRLGKMGQANFFRTDNKMYFNLNGYFHKYDMEGDSLVKMKYPVVGERFEDYDYGHIPNDGYAYFNDGINIIGYDENRDSWKSIFTSVDYGGRDGNAIYYDRDNDLLYLGECDGTTYKVSICNTLGLWYNQFSIIDSRFDTAYDAFFVVDGQVYLSIYGDPYDENSGLYNSIYVYKITTSGASLQTVIKHPLMNGVVKQMNGRWGIGHLYDYADGDRLNWAASFDMLEGTMHTTVADITPANHVTYQDIGKGSFYVDNDGGGWAYSYYTLDENGDFVVLSDGSNADFIPRLRSVGNREVIGPDELLYEIDMTNAYTVGVYREGSLVTTYTISDFIAGSNNYANENNPWVYGRAIKWANEDFNIVYSYDVDTEVITHEYLYNGEKCLKDLNIYCQHDDTLYMTSKMSYTLRTPVLYKYTDAGGYEQLATPPLIDYTGQTMPYCDYGDIETPSGGYVYRIQIATDGVCVLVNVHSLWGIYENGSAYANNEMFRYDIAGDSWTTIDTTATVGSSILKMQYFSGYFYLFTDGGGVFQYNDSNGFISVLNNVGTSESIAATFADASDTMYAMYDYDYGSIFEYNQSNDTWSSLGSLGYGKYLKLMNTRHNAYLTAYSRNTGNSTWHYFMERVDFVRGHYDKDLTFVSNYTSIIDATDISVIANNTIQSSTSDLSVFTNGDVVKLSGFVNGSNNGYFKITSVTSSTLEFSTSSMVIEGVGTVSIESCDYVEQNVDFRQYNPTSLWYNTDGYTTKTPFYQNTTGQFDIVGSTSNDGTYTIAKEIQTGDTRIYIEEINSLASEQSDTYTVLTPAGWTVWCAVPYDSRGGDVIRYTTPNSIDLTRDVDVDEFKGGVDTVPDSCNVRDGIFMTDGRMSREYYSYGWSAVYYELNGVYIYDESTSTTSLSYSQYSLYNNIYEGANYLAQYSGYRYYDKVNEKLVRMWVSGSEMFFLAPQGDWGVFISGTASASLTEVRRYYYDGSDLLENVAELFSINDELVMSTSYFLYDVHTGAFYYKVGYDVMYSIDFDNSTLVFDRVGRVGSISPDLSRAYEYGGNDFYNIDGSGNITGTVYYINDNGDKVEGNNIYETSGMQTDFGYDVNYDPFGVYFAEKMTYNSQEEVWGQRYMNRQFNYISQYTFLYNGVRYYFKMYDDNNGFYLYKYVDGSPVLEADIAYTTIDFFNFIKIDGDILTIHNYKHKLEVDMTTYEIVSDGKEFIEYPEGIQAYTDPNGTRTESVIENDDFLAMYSGLYADYSHDGYAHIYRKDNGTVQTITNVAHIAYDEESNLLRVISYYDGIYELDFNTSLAKSVDTVDVPFTKYNYSTMSGEISVACPDEDMLMIFSGQTVDGVNVNKAVSVHEGGNDQPSVMLEFKADSPKSHAFGGGCYYDGDVYLFGGYDSDGSAHGCLYQYNIGNDEYVHLATYPFPVTHCRVEYVHIYDGVSEYTDRVYVFGGYNAGELSSKVFYYDLKTLSWHNTEPMHADLYNVVPMQLNDRLWYMQGRVSGGAINTKVFSLDVYDEPSGWVEEHASSALAMNRDEYAKGDGFIITQGSTIYDAYIYDVVNNSISTVSVGSVMAGDFNDASFLPKGCFIARDDNGIGVLIYTNTFAEAKRCFQFNSDRISDMLVKKDSSKAYVYCSVPSIDVIAFYEERKYIWEFDFSTREWSRLAQVDTYEVDAYQAGDREERMWFVDNERKIVIGSQKGLRIYDIDTNSFTYTDYPDSNKGLSLAFDHGSDSYLIVYDYVSINYTGYYYYFLYKINSSYTGVSSVDGVWNFERDSVYFNGIIYSISPEGDIVTYDLNSNKYTDDLKSSSFLPTSNETIRINTVDSTDEKLIVYRDDKIYNFYTEKLLSMSQKYDIDVPYDDVSVIDINGDTYIIGGYGYRNEDVMNLSVSKYDYDSDSFFVKHNFHSIGSNNFVASYDVNGFKDRIYVFGVQEDDTNTTYGYLNLMSKQYVSLGYMDLPIDVSLSISRHEDHAYIWGDGKVYKMTYSSNKLEKLFTYSSRMLAIVGDLYIYYSGSNLMSVNVSDIISGSTSPVIIGAVSSAFSGSRVSDIYGGRAYVSSFSTGSTPSCNVVSVGDDGSFISEYTRLLGEAANPITVGKSCVNSDMKFRYFFEGRLIYED